MLILKAAGQDLVTQEIALTIARMVFDRQIGAGTTQSQSPLQVTDLGDRWEISGSNVIGSSIDLADPLGGRLKMVIMKRDGQIVMLKRELIPSKRGAE